MPESYIGTDMFPGPGVDEICNAERITSRFGEQAFDVVITTEMLEHVHNWWLVIENLKSVLRPDGILLITTRSRGFPFHEAPYDFWRYELDDMKDIFSDFIIESLEPDPEEPGVFLIARKPVDYSTKDLSRYLLYSMVTQTRVHAVEGPKEVKYEGRLLRREGNTPEDGKVYVVQKARRHWIIHARWVLANGFRWPDDVIVVPANELEEIPLGDPID